MDQRAFQKFISETFIQSQIRNPAYSLRAYARKLGLGFGTVSQIISGKRDLSLKSVKKVLDRLGADPVIRADILRETLTKLSYEETQLEADQYFILSEWYYLAILSLIRTRDFKSTPAHISSRLGISPALAKQAIERLLRVDLIRHEGKKLVRTKSALQTSDGKPNLALRKSHYEGLERARIALDEHPYESFDFTSLTFAFSPHDLAEAKKKIREYQDDFADRFSKNKNTTEVYRLAVQLFSLTKPHQSLATKPGDKI